MKFKKYRLLSHTISTGNFALISQHIQSSIKKKNTILISPIASYTLTKAVFHKNLRESLHKFTYLFPDSKWVCYALSFLYHIAIVPRIYGPNLMLHTCHLAQTKKYNIYLYGTTEKTLLKLRDELIRQFPKLSIVGYSPSVFRKLDTKEKKSLIAHIETSKADIVFLGLGSPLQELFAYELAYATPHYKNSVIIIPTGAAFDFISGVKPQAPLWMQNNGMEWFFRLISEPTRLWKRYLYYGPLFLILVLKQKFGMILSQNTYDHTGGN